MPNESNGNEEGEEESIFTRNMVQIVFMYQFLIVSRATKA
jgi:hypothetical protein